MAPTTPPPTSFRAHTPPTPLHGPLYDNYEPYSPRRSTRSTAQSNPYASKNADRSPNANYQRASTPPPTSKRARFAGSHLSSPPASPTTRTDLHKTPRETPSRRSVSGVQSDSDNTSQHPLATTFAPAGMLPTPRKTPKKRMTSSLNTTARVLNFQPYSPSDVMPTPRKMKKSHGHSTRGFDLYDDAAESSQDPIQIFTDSNARVPELDEADDNPFVGPRKTRNGRSQRRGSNARNEEEKEMEEAVAREEGIIYVFRGKKVLRRYSDSEKLEHSSPDSNMCQRSLRRQAGETASRPLTRSSIKPRLLFSSEEQLRERELVAAGLSEVDEEAETDIDVPVPTKRKTASSYLATPPSSKRTKRTVDRTAAASRLEIVTEEDESTPASPIEQRKAKSKPTSPFDSWQRTKGGPSNTTRKREAPDATVGPNKRTRSGMVSSPA